MIQFSIEIYKYNRLKTHFVFEPVIQIIHTLTILYNNLYIKYSNNCTVKQIQSFQHTIHLKITQRVENIHLIGCHFTRIKCNNTFSLNAML